MIKISDSFKTDSKSLAALYEGARQLFEGAVKEFGDYRLAVRDSERDAVSAASELMSAETLARYDMEAALDCVNVFLVTARADGRMACEILKKQDGIFCDYSRLAGFYIAEEALSLFYMSKKKELTYLDRLYAGLKNFDGYIWSTHDCNFNRLAELFSEKELAYGTDPARYAPKITEDSGRVIEMSPFPVESSIMAAFVYRLKETIAQIAKLLGDTHAEKYAREARELFDAVKKNFWISDAGVCYDRDYKGNKIPYLGMENLSMMYYGAFDKEMAEAFVREHLMNPDEFLTRLPLPEIPADLGGTVFGVTYRKMIRALERYGFYSELATLSKMVLDGLSTHNIFAEHYDPGTCEPIKNESSAAFVPTAAAVIELIARSYGVSLDFDRLVWGALGHLDESSSEYSFKWGGDTYSLYSEHDTSTGMINGKLLFTVTNGVRVDTDWFGGGARVINVTDGTLDCVFAYRDHTYSFTLEPNCQFCVDGDGTDQEKTE